MKYFVKLVDSQPDGDAVPEGSALITEEWVEFDMPAWPQTGYTYTIGPITSVDGVISAEWVAVEDATHDVRTTVRARQERESRDARIKAIEWRYVRYERNARLNLEQQDDIGALDTYVQALADVPTQAGFPWDIQWPEYNP
jgi:hypothetical protein